MTVCKSYYILPDDVFGPRTQQKKLLCIPLGVVQRYPLLSPTLEEKEDLELIDWFVGFFP